MPIEGKKIERVGIGSEIKERKEIKLEDVFEYSIEELRKKIEKNPAIDAFDKEHYYLPDLPKEQDIKEFLESNPKRFGEILGKLKKFEPKAKIEEMKEGLKTADERFIKDYLAYRNFSKLEKVEKLNPSEEIRKFVDKFISLQGTLDQESFEIFKEIIGLSPNKKEVELLEKMAEISVEPKIDFTWADFLKAARNNKLGAEEKKWIEIFLNKDTFEKAKANVKEIEKKLGASNINFVSQWQSGIKIGESAKKEKIVSELGMVKDVIQSYNLPELMKGDWLLDFNELPEEIKKSVLSQNFKERLKEFKLDIRFSDLDDVYKIFVERKDDINKKGERIKKLISDFRIEKIGGFKFKNMLSFPERIIDKALERDFSSVPKELEDIISDSFYYKQISAKIFENIRKTKGDFLAKDISRNLLKYISSSLTFSFLSFEKPPKHILNKLDKLEKKNPKLYNKILEPKYHLTLEDVIPGRKATDRLIEKGNVEYLSAAQKLGISLDIYGIIGMNLEEIKNYIEVKVKDIIEDYDKKMHKSHLPVIVGYGAEYKKTTNEILKIKNLWDFKFSQEKDLYKILENIKDLKIEVKDKIKRGKKEISLESVEIIKKPEEYLSAMNIEPICMSVTGDFNYGALAITAGPILAIKLGGKDGEIVGRKIIIPIEDESGKWRFEEKASYGLGGNYMDDFTRQMEKILREKNKDYYRGVDEIVTKNLIKGRLPKTKIIRSMDPEVRKFWREDSGLVTLEEAK